MKKWIPFLKKAGFTLIFILFSGLLFFFLFRNSILEWVIDKARYKLQSRYSCNLSVGKTEMSGFTQIALSQVCITPQIGDSVLYIKNLQAGIRVFPLLWGQIRLKSLNVDAMNLNLVRYDSAHANYLSLFNSEKKIRAGTENPNKNLAKEGYKLINRLMDQIPGNFSITNSTFQFINLIDTYRLEIPKAILENENLKGSQVWVSPGKSQNIQIDGTLDPVDMNANIRIKPIDEPLMYIPFIDKKYNLLMGAGEVNLKLDEVDFSGNELHINSFASYSNIEIQHNRLAGDSTIRMKNGSGDFHFTISENAISLDSTSKIYLNKITLTPYLAYIYKPVKSYIISMKMDRIPAQEFFNSLPDGMFDGLNGIQVRGNLSYKMHFFLSDTNPSEVEFDSEIFPDNFQVISWGKAYLPVINGSFVYTPYEYGRPAKIIEVGEANPEYTRLEHISDFLKNAVLTSEDPSFYFHHGFVMEAIRGSIAQNYIRRRFARGASTISMQLVKNIFLSRKKTLSRKIEEMLLVWLMENSHVTSKNRIFEVYLNIIEWGPGVYGIADASHYYFKKYPSELTLPESVFLSSIIPRPKGFMWNFNDTTGLLKPHMEKYIQRICRVMAARKLVEESDTAMLNYQIKITGDAFKRIGLRGKNKTDSTQLLIERTDLNELDELQDMPPY